MYHQKPMRMPLLQTFHFPRPPKGAKIPIYYTEQYDDYVLRADQPELASQIFFLLSALFFFAVGLLLICRYIIPG